MVQKSKIHVIYPISQNLSLQMEFFPDTVRNTSSDVRGKLSLTSYIYWRNHIACRLGQRDLLSPHPFLDFLSLRCGTAFRARVKTEGTCLLTQETTLPQVMQ